MLNDQGAEAALAGLVLPFPLVDFYLRLWVVVRILYKKGHFHFHSPVYTKEVYMLTRCTEQRDSCLARCISRKKTLQKFTGSDI